MTRYTKLTPDDHIDTTVVFPIPNEADFFEFHFPENFDFERQGDWRIVDGQLVHDPLPEEEPKLSELDALRKEVLQTQIGLAEFFEMVMGGM